MTDSVIMCREMQHTAHYQEVLGALEAGKAFYTHSPEELAPHDKYRYDEVLTATIAVDLSKAAVATLSSAPKLVLNRLPGRAALSIGDDSRVEVQFSVLDDDEPTREAVAALAAWMTRSWAVPPTATAITYGRAVLPYDEATSGATNVRPLHRPS